MRYITISLSWYCKTLRNNQPVRLLNLSCRHCIHFLFCRINCVFLFLMEKIFPFFPHVFHGHKNENIWLFHMSLGSYVNSCFTAAGSFVILKVSMYVSSPISDKWAPFQELIWLLLTRKLEILLQIWAIEKGVLNIRQSIPEVFLNTPVKSFLF